MTPSIRSGRCDIPAWQHDSSPPSHSSLVTSWCTCAAHTPPVEAFSIAGLHTSVRQCLLLMPVVPLDYAASVICRQRCRGTMCQTFPCPPPAAGIASAAPTPAVALVSTGSMRPGTLSMTATPPSPATCQQMTCLTAMSVRPLVLFICQRRKICGARLGQVGRSCQRRVVGGKHRRAHA